MKRVCRHTRAAQQHQLLFHKQRYRPEYADKVISRADQLIIGVSGASSISIGWILSPMT